MIELRHLRYVVAAAEQGSIRQAALAVGVRESAVSRRIRDLEDEMGSALFVRHRSGVSLTHAGELFVRRARRVLNQINYAEKDVGAAGRGEVGLVRIGVFCSVTSGFITDLLEAYAADHAGVRLDFIEGGPSDHALAVRRHQIDVAFLIMPPHTEDCEITQLWTEKVYVVMRESDELALRDEILWEDLRDRQFVVSEAQPGPEVYDYIVKKLASRGCRASIHQQAVHRDTLMQIVATGQKLTVVGESTIATRFPGVAYRPLCGETLTFCAIWSAGNDNPAFRRFLSLARRLSRHKARI